MIFNKRAGYIKCIRPLLLEERYNWIASTRIEINAHGIVAVSSKMFLYIPLTDVFNWLANEVPQKGGNSGSAATATFPVIR